MKLERIAVDKFKVFVTMDDLTERGLTKEDLWQNAPKVQQLFYDVMHEASHELGFEIDGKLDVEVYSLQAQGMIIIVTKESVQLEEIDEDADESYVEMQVTLDECLDVLYEFSNFEDVISVSHRLNQMKLQDGRLYSFENKYYLFFDPKGLEEVELELLVAVLAEYGVPSVTTIHRIEEYGKKLMSENAIEQIVHYFNK